MKRNHKLTGLALGLALALFGTACVTQPTGNSNSEPGRATPSPSASPTASTDVSAAPVTLPVLDAFFASDETFATELKTKLSLTDDQITQLRAVAREETSKLRETETGDHSGTTAAARELAANRVKQIVGADKESQLAALVSERWRVGSDDPNAKDAKATAAAESLPTSPNAVPTDTRVVVNAPAYRMDVFDAGRLVRSYKVGIGYPEFPLPTGVRKARAIIFNPTWTPPDEPWVESRSSKVKVGEKVEAGSKLNPLGLLKIPIGSPSLIHGGKSPAKLGTFASHGCVGLTDALAQDFAKILAQLAGKKLSDADIANYKKNRSETKQVTLGDPVPVELRYETIVAEDGKLHIYRDVYDRNTNSEENLRAVLEANGVKLEDLTEEERSQVLEALEEMSRDAKGKPDQDAVAIAKTTASPSVSPVPSPKTMARKGGRITRSFKGMKEIVIEIAALKGKGYPAMAASGAPARKAKS